MFKGDKCYGEKKKNKDCQQGTFFEGAAILNRWVREGHDEKVRLKDWREIWEGAMRIILFIAV